MCHCGNTWVEWTPNKSQHTELIVPALMIFIRWHCGGTISYSERMHAMFRPRHGSPNICLSKATALRRETQSVCENQPIPSHRFAQFKRRCAQNSKRLLRTPADEKDGSSKIASSREGAVSVDRCAEEWVVPLSRRNQSWPS